MSQEKIEEEGKCGLFSFSESEGHVKARFVGVRLSFNISSSFCPSFPRKDATYELLYF